jgi:hypothetical protein
MQNVEKTCRNSVQAEFLSLQWPRFGSGDARYTGLYCGTIWEKSRTKRIFDELLSDVE